MGVMGTSFVDVATWFILGYFIALNAGYLALNFLSLASLNRGRQEAVLEELPQVFTGLDPAISILVPAYNEQAGIAASVRSMLQLSYSSFEIIVINDGSTDKTMETLTRAFALELFPEAVHRRLETKPIRAVYRSRTHANLRVVDKDNGGKADSLNAGINLARHALFCGVDADSLLARDSLQRVVRPFLRDWRVVATGGTVRIGNGCEIQEGFLTQVRLPSNPWALFQVVEYLRAFLFGRLGWSQLNAMLIISGAFGLFKTSVVTAAGGYRPKTIGEDMELVVRIHRMLREQQVDYRVEFVPEPVCWTEAPEDFKTLRNQRIRWQRGLSESLSGNWGLMFNRRGGPPGWLAFPFMVAFEWLGPVIELGGYVFMLVAFVAGLISWQAFAVFLFVAIGLGVLLSTSGLLLEEMAFHLYPKLSDLALLALVVVAENLGYRQLNSWWRLVGLYRWATQGEARWGEMKRKGLGN
jgi:cellulose synthase/poly-beta-1,6-N-acetylglucosamine synthase-like glycosyltransferase